MTAVEWLVEKVNSDCLNSTFIRKELIDEAKEMHKQEIIDAWNGGDYAYFYSKETGRDFADGSEYYQETLGSKGSDDAQLSQQEISDEEIEEEISKRYMHPTQDYAFRDACKWYREQLKQRQ